MAPPIPACAPPTVPASGTLDHPRVWPAFRALFLLPLYPNAGEIVHHPINCLLTNGQRFAYGAIKKAEENV
jgi:hypothetical protein